MTASHAEIQAFLKDFESADVPAIRKAGLVPFLRGPLRYYVMMPSASKPDLGLPEFQLCKGTRMFQVKGTWQDMKGHVPEEAALEPLPVTSLREGIEELGLKLENIARIVPLGEFHFTSATSRTEVALWMLAAEIKDAGDFLPPHASTAECRWMTLAEFGKHGRPDHAHILGLIEEQLTRHCEEA